MHNLTNIIIVVDIQNEIKSSITELTLGRRIRNLDRFPFSKTF